ncbi:MAG: D-alanine--D-alanine ligase [Candidatus Hydrogenedentes bacterium]|jgi:D-alanine-D-alanine ligase|nr:D-alanine--D-alanine ligase [Candidatus Hydrogenedentota bacterium]
MGNKATVAVLMGGLSLEHEVSLRSGEGVAAALLAMGYRVIKITICKDGRWQLGAEPPMSVFKGLRLLETEHVDCVFIALHGTYGEDGRIQGLLDVLGFPYTGSGCAASALCMDKSRSKDVVAASGVSTALKFCVTLSEWQERPQQVINRSMDLMGFPVVLKAPCQGSSCGLAIVQNEDEFTRNMNEILLLEGLVMVEAYITGLEVTCSVLDTIQAGSPQALPVTEIRPKESSFFDYYSKYTPGATREITPAQIGESLTQQVQEQAVAAHTSLGCQSWSRSDFIIGEKGPVWLEVNTLPGLTETSLFPQAAAEAGISYNELVCMLTEDAMDRHRLTSSTG